MVIRTNRIRRWFAGLVLSFVATSAAVHAAAPTPAAPPRPIVYGYLPSWFDKKAPPAEMDFSGYTHLARAFLRPRPDGTILPDEGYFDAGFEAAAHKAGVKLIMSLGGSARKPDPWTSLANNPDYTKTFLDTLAKFYADHGYDGVDIDWEPTPQNEAGGRDYLNLVRQIRQRFPNKQLTITVSGKRYALQYLPLKELMPLVDHVNAMFYDYNASWTGVAGFASNLNPDTNPAAGSTFSVNTGLNILINEFHVPPSKLVGGVTFWGYRFRADTLGQKFPKDQKEQADSIETGRVADLLATGKYTAQRSESAGADYLVRGDGGSLIAYETPQSIREKCRRFQQLGLAGVMIWSVNADLNAGRTPLLSVIGEAYGRPPLPLGETSLRGEVGRLRGKPATSGETVEQLLASDRTLRAEQAEAEDARWAKLVEKH